jgi:hypothetical protein
LGELEGGTLEGCREDCAAAEPKAPERTATQRPGAKRGDGDGFGTKGGSSRGEEYWEVDDWRSRAEEKSCLAHSERGLSKK